jgi:hypothetical protein
MAQDYLERAAPTVDNTLYGNCVRPNHEHQATNTDLPDRHSCADKIKSAAWFENPGAPQGVAVSVTPTSGRQASKRTSSSGRPQPASRFWIDARARIVTAWTEGFLTPHPRPSTRLGSDGGDRGAKRFAATDRLRDCRASFGSRDITVILRAGCSRTRVLLATMPKFLRTKPGNADTTPEDEGANHCDQAVNLMDRDWYSLAARTISMTRPRSTIGLVIFLPSLPTIDRAYEKTVTVSSDRTAEPEALPPYRYHPMPHLALTAIPLAIGLIADANTVADLTASFRVPCTIIYEERSSIATRCLITLHKSDDTIREIVQTPNGRQFILEDFVSDSDSWYLNHLPAVETAQGPHPCYQIHRVTLCL